MPELPDTTPTISEARRAAARRLQGSTDTPDLDSELLIRAVFGLDRAGLILRDPEPLDPDDAAAYEQLVQRRLDGEPVAYILHRAPFRELMLYVDDRVLIPRPETEEMVQIGLDWLAKREGPLRVADVGTGSGAIASALASEIGDRDDVEVVATDISTDALNVAAINRERLGLTSKVRLVRTNLLDGVEERFDLILANLPYLRPDQRHPSTWREPDSALYAGSDGFDYYRILIPNLHAYLKRDGLFVAEIDPDQKEIALRLARASLPWPATVIQDLSGRDRFLVLGEDAERIAARRS